MSTDQTIAIPNELYDRLTTIEPELSDAGVRTIVSAVRRGERLTPIMRTLDPHWASRSSAEQERRLDTARALYDAVYDYRPTIEPLNWRATDPYGARASVYAAQDGRYALTVDEFEATAAYLDLDQLRDLRDALTVELDRRLNGA
jgi:hypothetical protein